MVSATSKIHYCIGSLNVGVAPRVQHFSAFHLYSYSLANSNGLQIQLYTAIAMTKTI